MSEPLLLARGLVKTYGSEPRTIDVLRGLDLEIDAGQAMAIVGDSGVGKSTLLHILGGIDRPQSGDLRYRGLDLLAADSRALAEFRNRNVGFVFQAHHLMPELTALENVELPLRIARMDHGHGGVAQNLLERLGLRDRVTHLPTALSGGEQQRVAIARALVRAPEIVLADEPTGNLDPATGRQVFELLRELQQERGFALVLATHNERLAGECDAVLRVEEGRLRTLGDAETREYFNGLRA